jgi:flagellar hook-associated protein 2
MADTTVGTATTTNSAVAGTYSIDVTALATQQRLNLGKTYAATDPVIDFSDGNTHTLSFTKAGGTPTTITLDSSQNTLAGVRDAINNSNAGVGATIVTGTDGKQNLLLSASTGGTANAVTVSGDAAFLDPAAPGSTTTAASAFTQTQAAADAVVKVQGLSIATSGNTVTNAIDGVTLNLAKTGSTTLTIGRNTTDLQTKLQTFVTAYNSLNSSIKSLSAYDPTSKSGAILNGDSSLRTVQSQLRAALGANPTTSSGNAAIAHLSDIGVSFQSDGSLAFDTTKFAKASTSDFNATASVIGNYGAALTTTTTSLLNTGGVMASHTAGLSASVKAMGNQITALSGRLTSIEAGYRAQFTALDTAMASMNTTSTYLTQQLARL